MQSPKRSNIFAWVIISVVAVLLGAFLALQFGKTKDPKPEPDPVAATDGGKTDGEVKNGGTDDGGTTEPEPPPPDPKQEEREKLTAEIETLLRKDDLEAAREKLRALRDLEADAELVARLQKGIDDAVTARKEKEKRAAIAAFTDRVKDLRKYRAELQWDKLDEAFDQLEKDYPAVVGVAEYRSERKQAGELAAEARKHFRDHLNKARKAMDERKYREAALFAKESTKLYPEREAQVETLIRKAVDELLGRDMAFIPAPPRDRSWIVGGDEFQPHNPRREFRRKDFYIDKLEVTNEMYELFILLTGHGTPGASRVWIRGQLHPQYRQHPVVGITQKDAAAFARWAGKRLPTQEEWEVAARWLDGRRFPWGANFQPDEKTYLCNSVEYTQSRNKLNTTEVGSFPAGASPYGVLDLAGNAWEWTSTSVKGENDQELFVCKGGSFMTPLRMIRSGGLLLEDPGLGHHDVGFRCVRDPE